MSHPRISLVKATANSNSLNVAIALSEAYLLHELITTIAYNPQGTLAAYLKHLPNGVRKAIEQELGRRAWLLPDIGSLRAYYWREIFRLVLVRTELYRPLGFNQASLIDWVYTSLDRCVAKDHLHDVDAVYAYEDEAAITFQVAKQQGIKCLYDLPIPFYRTSRAIQIEEAERFPELASAIQAIQEPAWKIERKEAEVQLADHIFVASSMTQQSLLDSGIEPQKISVIPYGAPTGYFYPQPKSDQSFRALFVGRVSPRKGVHYLLQAWEELRLHDAELLFVGSNIMPEGWLEQHSDRCRHIDSVAHASLNQYYSSASVLVFPSLVEGFGLAITEAMACGIPVITTPNTAAPDIITDGIEGFIIPIRDVEALKEKLEWCYSHPQELVKMGQAARRKAEKLSWQQYRWQLINNIQKVL